MNVFFAVLLFSVLSQTNMAYRVWTDKTGKDTVEAKLVHIEAGRATLQKKNGKRVIVPIDGLCEMDQMYIRDHGDANTKNAQDNEPDVRESKNGSKAQLLDSARKKTPGTGVGKKSDAGQAWPFSTPIPDGYSLDGSRVVGITGSFRPSSDGYASLDGLRVEVDASIVEPQPRPEFRVYSLKGKQSGQTRRVILVVRPEAENKEVPFGVDFARRAAEAACGLGPHSGFEKASMRISVPPKRNDGFHVLNFKVDGKRPGKEDAGIHVHAVISTGDRAGFAVIGASLQTESEMRITTDIVQKLADNIKEDRASIISDSLTDKVARKSEVVDSRNNDEQRLQGTWVPNTIKVNVPGFPSFSGEAARIFMHWTLEGDKLTIGGNGDNGGLEMRIVCSDDRIGLFRFEQPKQLTFALIHTKKIQGINIIEGRTTIPGIYSWDGNNLKICLDISGRKRPVDFAAKEQTTQVLFLLNKRSMPNSSIAKTSQVPATTRGAQEEEWEEVRTTALATSKTVVVRADSGVEAYGGTIAALLTSGLDGEAQTKLDLDAPGSLFMIAKGGVTWKGTALVEGRIYLVDANRMPCLTHGDYSAWVMMKENRKIYATKECSGAPLLLVRAGERLELLLPANKSEGVHKVRAVPGGAEAWMRDGWDKLVFMRRKPGESERRE